MTSTQSFGEMIAALQFQDITRQRIEHVQKALANLVQHLEKFNQTADGQPRCRGLPAVRAHLPFAA